MSVFKPIRVTESQLSSLSIIDGQLIFVTDTNKIYLDNNGNRSEYNNNEQIIFFPGLTYEETKKIYQQMINFHLKGKTCLYIESDNQYEEGVIYTFMKGSELHEENNKKYYNLKGILPIDNISNSSGSNISFQINGRNLRLYVSSTDLTKFDSATKNVISKDIAYLDTIKDNNFYTPTLNYHPATKKYVDDSIKTAIGDVLGGSY